jgi:hypothetical protein
MTPTNAQPLVLGYTSPDAPAGYRAAARLLMPTLSTLKKDVGKLEMHPVIFHGDDLDTVCATAQKWWADEVERERLKAEGMARRAEAARAARLAKAAGAPDAVSLAEKEAGR